MSKVFREIALWIILLILLMSLLQTERLSYYYQSLSLFKLYFWISIGVISICTYLLVRIIIRKESLIPLVFKKFKSLAIPKGARILITVVFIGNLLAITLGKAWYPFYDVGMFRWSSPFESKNKIMHQLKYYYWKDGQFKILDLRKEGSLFLAENLGLGYTEDFMFSARFRNRGEKKNFEYLSARMKERGVDTLWVGIHEFNFETRKVSFDPDICRAVTMNETLQHYYGPLYIPGYQLSRCHAH